MRYEHKIQLTCSAEFRLRFCCALEFVCELIGRLFNLRTNYVEMHVLRHQYNYNTDKAGTPACIYAEWHIFENTHDFDSMTEENMFLIDI